MNLFIVAHAPSYTAVLIAADNSDHASTIAKASSAFEGLEPTMVRPLDVPPAGGVLLHLEA